MGRLFSLCRYPSYYLRFKSCGHNVVFSQGGKIIRPEEMELGNDIYISRHFHISARNVKIGNSVMIGPNLVLESDDHVFNKPGVIMFEDRQTRHLGCVRIENDVWCGANVTILKGAILSEGCVVGAGSIVTKKMPPYSICVGSPCRPVKARFAIDDLRTHLTRVDSACSLEDVLAMWRSHNLS